MFFLFFQFALFVLFAGASIGQGTDDKGSSSATIFLPHGQEDHAKSAPLKNANSGTVIGEVTSNVIRDILVVELKSIEGQGASMNGCVMAKEVHRRSGSSDKEINDFDKERTSPVSFFFGTDMKLVREYCDNHDALDTGKEKQWNDSYSVIGEISFRCYTQVDDVPAHVQPLAQEQTDEVKHYPSASSLRATRSLRNKVTAQEKVISHFEIIVACDTQNLNGSVENEDQFSIANLQEGGAATMHTEDQLSICPEVNLSACPGRSANCVAALLWDQKPLPYVPTEGADDSREITFNGRKIWRYKVGYTATDRAVGKPFTGDKHRALILTQPKVGTGAIWEAMSSVTDFLLRSHEVGILRPNSLWVPFPECTAKPSNGECTAFFGFRDPRTWLDSAYFQCRSNRPGGEIVLDSDEEVRAYHKFFRDPTNRGEVLDWWRIAEQLRLLGIPSASVTPFLKSVMDSGGVKIIAPDDLPESPRWISGCNIVVLQMEMAKYDSKAERVIQSILPDFHFQKPEENVGRADLNPELAATYSVIKEAELPTDIMETIFTESSDFHEAWELYHKK